MAVYLQTNARVQLTNANTAISAVNTGKIHFIPALTVGTKTYTLPPVAAGLHYRFIAAPVGANLSQIAAIVAPAAAAIIQGALVNTNTGAGNVSTIVAKANGTFARFTATAVKGDYIDLYCDGTNWHVSGISSVIAGLA